jgi:hypothetical protein
MGKKLYTVERVIRDPSGGFVEEGEVSEYLELDDESDPPSARLYMPGPGVIEGWITAPHDYAFMRRLPANHRVTGVEIFVHQAFSAGTFVEVYGTAISGDPAYDMAIYVSTVDITTTGVKIPLPGPDVGAFETVPRDLVVAAANLGGPPTVGRAHVIVHHVLGAHPGVGIVGGGSSGPGGELPTAHDPVTLGAGSDAALDLAAGQVLTLDLSGIMAALAAPGDLVPSTEDWSGITNASVLRVIDCDALTIDTLADAFATFVADVLATGLFTGQET